MTPTRFYVKQEKIRLDKQSDEYCPQCKERLVNSNGTYCRCWEDQIPELGKGRHIGKSRILPVGSFIERSGTTLPSWEKIKEIPKAKLIANLKAFGLEAYEIEIIYQRFFDEMTFKEIVKKSGWTTTGAASYVFRKTLAKLRKRGFNFR